MLSPLDCNPYVSHFDTFVTGQKLGWHDNSDMIIQIEDR